MPETTPLIKAALNLRGGAGFDVYLFADTWSGISVAERSLTYGTNMGVLTALNKKHQNPP